VIGSGQVSDKEESDIVNQGPFDMGQSSINSNENLKKKGGTKTTTSMEDFEIISKLGMYLINTFSCLFL
jgi:hypothetical protein